MYVVKALDQILLAQHYAGLAINSQSSAVQPWPPYRFFPFVAASL